MGNDSSTAKSQISAGNGRMSRIIFTNSATNPHIKHAYVADDGTIIQHRLRTRWTLQLHKDDSFTFETKVSCIISRRRTSVLPPKPSGAAATPVAFAASERHNIGPVKQEPIQEVTYYGGPKSVRLVHLPAPTIEDTEDQEDSSDEDEQPVSSSAALTAYSGSRAAPKVGQLLLDLLPDKPLASNHRDSDDVDDYHDDTSVYSLLLSLQTQLLQRRSAQKHGLISMGSLKSVAFSMHPERVEYKLKRPSRVVPLDFFRQLVSRAVSPPVSPERKARSLRAAAKASTPPDTMQPVVEDDEKKTGRPVSPPQTPPKALKVKEPVVEDTSPVAMLQSPHVSRGTGSSPMMALQSPHVSRASRSFDDWPDNPNNAQKRGRQSISSVPTGGGSGGSSPRGVNWDLDGLIDPEYPDVLGTMNSMTEQEEADLTVEEDEKQADDDKDSHYIKRVGKKAKPTEPDFLISAGRLDMVGHVDSKGQTLQLALVPLALNVDTRDVADPNHVDVDFLKPHILELHNSI